MLQDVAKVRHLCCCESSACQSLWLHAHLVSAAHHLHLVLLPDRNVLDLSTETIRVVSRCVSIGSRLCQIIESSSHDWLLCTVCALSAIATHLVLCALLPRQRRGHELPALAAGGCKVSLRTAVAQVVSTRAYGCTGTDELRATQDG